MKRFLFFAAFATAALVSCNKAEVETYVPDTNRAVKFTVENISSYVFKSPTLGLGADGCSTVGIYAADLGANNVEATVSGTSLTPASTIYWGVGQTTPTTFVARYPYYVDATINDAYAIPADQSSEDTFTYQANFMSAVQSASPDPGTVTFDFKHPFAKIVVNITNNLGADAVQSVVMKQLKMSASTLDLTTAPATPTLEETKTDVTACLTGENEYSMIVMPQAATNEMDIVVTTTLGSVYTFRITGDYTFQAGKVATANLTLNPAEGQGGSRTPVGALTFGTPDWSSGSAATVDAVDTPVVGNYFQIGGCVYSAENKGDDAWAKYYNMLCTAENVWTVTINYDEAMTDDESGKGFIVRRGEAYYGMWTGSENVTADYNLDPTDETHKNVKLASAGNYTLVFTYLPGENKVNVTTITRNGDAE